MRTEKFLTLPDGRILAYEDSGEPTSSLIVIFFHGAFGVGYAPAVLPPALMQKRAHYIAPTLAGWGASSPRPSTMSYAAALASDTTALINHLHPDTSNLRIYIGGGSYGTAPAQMLYGAPFDVFPLGRNVVGCVICAPFSPFKWHKEYTKAMTWENYMSVGPPARAMPFQLLQRVAASAIAIKFSSVDKAEKFIRGYLFDGAPPEERAAYAKWRESCGEAEGVVERQMAEDVVKSISKTFAGFIEVADVLASDWGFAPNLLDEAHTAERPIYIFASTGDELGPDMANWLEANYRNSNLKWITGKHNAALYEMDNSWTEILKNEPET
ncbi:Alpha/Beta hydrolase protein [Mycena rebaudengoi]|nr:Alpha/Beta hydrolase protein [Mycena rebaudengoi]